MKFRSVLAGAAALALSGTLVLAAGLWPNFPTPGGSPLTNPPTGNETIPADTQLPSGENPATEVIPLGLIANMGGVGQKNLVIGGDFAQNSFTLGTTPVSAATPSSAVEAADHWYAYSSTNTVTVIKETGSTDIIPSAGLLASMRVSRPSTTTATAICVGQVMDQAQFAAAQGHTVVLSFWALAGAALTTVANNQITPAIRYYTTTDNATAGTNTLTYAAGTTTNLTNVAPAAATTISTTWTRYSVSGVVPTATAAGTAVTGGGVDFCYTPASGTGGTTEWFELAGVQLEVMQGTNTVPSQFEHRLITLEQALQQRYFYGFKESATSGAQQTASGQGATTTTCQLFFPFPVVMRTAPTFAAGGTALSTSTWTITHVATATALASTFLVVLGANTPTGASMTATVASGLTAGQTCVLTSANGRYLDLVG